MAKARKRVNKKLNMDRFLFNNIRIMMFLLVLIIVLMLLNYTNTQTIFEDTIAGELKGGISAGCTDSDSYNYYTFGYVTYRGITYYDECLSSKVLEEGICSRSKYNSVTYTCPFGCAGGKCLSTPTTTTIIITTTTTTFVTTTLATATTSTTTTLPANCLTSSSSCFNPDGDIPCGSSLSSCLNANDWKYYYVPGSAYKNVTVYLGHAGSGCNVNDLYVFNSDCTTLHSSGTDAWVVTWSGISSSDIIIAVDGDSSNPNCYWNMTVQCYG